MSNEDGSIWIAFNGEIYNFRELRADLLKRGHVFRSNCDTEVIIHLYEEHGADCLQHLRGMFGFALWDSNRRQLLLARDRIGIKPLYYCQTNQGLFFGSELKSIIADPDVPRDLNLCALRQFLSFTYAAGCETPFRAIRKLPPGSYLVAQAGKTTIRSYWDLQFTQDRYNCTFGQVVEELHDLLRETVRDHMIADVPVGILLSGGIDSSAIASFAVEASPHQVHSFTVGFDSAQVVDERPYARLAAERYGTNHHDITISLDDFWNFLPRYIWHMEELVCEPPAVALHYVSQLARNHVKVLLSGEGGDEAFAGYPNYPNGLALARLEQVLGPLARPFGTLASLSGDLFSVPRLQRFGSMLGRHLSEHYFSRSSGPRHYFNHEVDTIFSADFIAATRLATPDRLIYDLLAGKEAWHPLNQMLYADIKTWLPDDLLIKADRITMASSLELRVPLLDHRVLEFAASIPTNYKVKGRKTKRILKTAFSSTVPQEILNRKKAGFPVPYAAWLRGPLAQPACDILLSHKSRSRGYIKRSAVETLIQQAKHQPHLAKPLFQLIILELWHQTFIDTPPMTLASHQRLAAV